MRYSLLCRGIGIATPKENSLLVYALIFFVSWPSFEYYPLAEIFSIDYRGDFLSIPRRLALCSSPSCPYPGAGRVTMCYDNHDVRPPPTYGYRLHY